MGIRRWTSIAALVGALALDCREPNNEAAIAEQDYRRYLERQHNQDDHVQEIEIQPILPTPQEPRQPTHEQQAPAVQQDTAHQAQSLFSSLSDGQRRSILIDIVRRMHGSYTFPVPRATTPARQDALSVGRTYYEFGAGRGSTRHHNAVDIYAFGETVVAFSEGTVEQVGRHRHAFDHGNIIIIRHAPVLGYAIHTTYLHVGAVASSLAQGTQVRQGEQIARVDCTGISNEQFVLYTLGSRMCRQKSHLHFQITVGDSHVNPNYFFSDYAASALPTLQGYRLSQRGRSIEDRIVPFEGNDALGSFR